MICYPFKIWCKGTAELPRAQYSKQSVLGISQHGKHNPELTKIEYRSPRGFS